MQEHSAYFRAAVCSAVAAESNHIHTGRHGRAAADRAVKWDYGVSETRLFYEHAKLS